MLTWNSYVLTVHIFFVWLNHFFFQPKADWRAQHENFIKAIRYAKGLSDEPPPPAENPEYIQCPHCERRFKPATAERHIPKCKDIKAKPSRLKKKRWKQYWEQEYFLAILLQIAILMISKLQDQVSEPLDRQTLSAFSCKNISSWRMLEVKRIITFYMKNM